MNKYKATFLHPALDDLEEIILYIAQGSSDAALKMHDEIISKARKLNEKFELNGVKSKLIIVTNVPTA